MFYQYKPSGNGPGSLIGSDSILSQEEIRILRDAPLQPLDGNSGSTQKTPNADSCNDKKKDEKSEKHRNIP